MNTNESTTPTRNINATMKPSNARRSSLGCPLANQRADVAALAKEVQSPARRSGGRHARSAPGREPAAAKGTAPDGAAAGHSKKNLGHHLRTVRQRFQRIKAMQPEYSIDQLCRTLGGPRKRLSRVGRSPARSARAGQCRAPTAPSNKPIWKAAALMALREGSGGCNSAAMPAAAIVSQGSCARRNYAATPAAVFAR